MPGYDADHATDGANPGRFCVHGGTAVTEGPTVYVDDQIFTGQRHGGISRYFSELMCRFAEPEYPVRLVGRKPWTRNEYLVRAGLGRYLGYPQKAHRLVRRINRLGSIGMELDIIHHTSYFKYYLRWYRRPRVRAVTIYDMIPELYPEYFPRGNPHRSKREYVRAADIVFCISETTRGDLFKVYGDVPCPVVVTPLGVSPVFRPDLDQLPGMEDPYILFVGERGGYKEFETLARALAASTVMAEYRLEVVGGGPIRPRELEFLTTLGIADRVAQWSLSEEELARAYSNAQMFVFPSLYEGFGLPTLEAMASGCVALLADSPTHREVGGDSAIYFRAGDELALQDRLEALVDDTAARQRLRIAGRRRAETYTWDRTAEMTADGYLSRL